jgi:hypothetical protein
MRLRHSQLRAMSTKAVRKAGYPCRTGGTQSGRERSWTAAAASSRDAFEPDPGKQIDNPGVLRIQVARLLHSVRPKLGCGDSGFGV